MRIQPDGLTFTLLLGALAGLPALSIDMSLPAMPQLQIEFAASPATVALSLSYFMLGFGAAQILIGPLSDRAGRRPVLLVALALYALGGLACRFAPSIGALLAGRAMQGAGAAGGTVLAFAIIRDLFDGDAARARLSTVSLVFSLAPVIAPALGGMLLESAGWRAIFLFQMATGVVLLLAVAAGLGESRRPGPAAPYLAILRQGRSLAFSAVGALNLGNVFCFVSGAPLVLLDSFHLSTAAFSGVFALVTGGVIAGAALNRLAVRRGWHAAWPLGFGLAAAAIGGLAGAALGLGGALGVIALVPVFLLTTLSRGLVSPNVTHAALERVPRMAGAASALVGCSQMLTGALAGFIVGQMFDWYGPVGLMLTMAGFAVAALACWIWVELNYR